MVYAWFRRNTTSAAPTTPAALTTLARIWGPQHNTIPSETRCGWICTSYSVVFTTSDLCGTENLSGKVIITSFRVHWNAALVVRRMRYKLNSVASLSHWASTERVGFTVTAGAAGKNGQCGAVVCIYGPVRSVWCFDSPFMLGQQFHCYFGEQKCLEVVQGNQASGNHHRISCIIFCNHIQVFCLAQHIHPYRYTQDMQFNWYKYGLTL